MGESTLDDIIKGFKNANDTSDSWSVAFNELNRFAKGGLSVEDGLKVIEAAGAISFPSQPMDLADSQAQLIQAATTKPYSQYVAPLVQYFANFTPYAKFYALNLLASIRTREATQAWLNLIRQFAHDPTLKDIATEPFRREPHDGDILFPALLEWATIERFRFKIYYLCLTYGHAGLLNTETLAPYSESLLSQYQGYKTRLQTLLQEIPPPDKDSEAVFNEKRYVKLMLDAMAFFPSSAVTAELRETLASEDVELRYFAAISLLIKGEDVAPSIVAEFAKNAELRNWLSQRLETLNRLDLYPKEFYSQAAFAELELVHWLTFPSELGYAPDEIELGKVVSIDTQTSDGMIDYYVFRFRMLASEDEAENEWMAGVAGPYLKKEGITAKAQASAFSSFKPYDNATPEEHVGNITEILEDWRKYHFGE